MALLLIAMGTACGVRTDTRAEPNRSEPTAAKVGGDVVTVRQVDELLSEAPPIFRRRGRLFPAKNDPYYADLRDEAIRYLVERTLREQFAESVGVDVEASTRNDSLYVDTYRAVAESKREDETIREALARNREILEESFAQVRYAHGFRPAAHRRSLPPELPMLPKPKASCDLKTGMYPYFVARAYGCLGPGDNDVRYVFPPCPEIPARERIDPGLTDAEVNRGYADYAMSGTAAHDFFEPLTTNREDLASEENAEGPECQDFPGEALVSVGDIGFRSMPFP